MDLWSGLWVGIGAAVIGLVALVFAAARRPSLQDLGSVSSRWIAEKGAGQPEAQLAEPRHASIRVLTAPVRAWPSRTPARRPDPSALRPAPSRE